MTSGGAAQMAATLALLVKYNKTTLVLSVDPQTSIKQLKSAILGALVESQQPVDEQLGRPFADASEQDVQVFRGDATQPSPVYEALDNDATVTGLGLANLDSVYIGFRRPGADVPAQPVVYIPSFDDELEE
ncbi:hypothetical protein MCUN1_000092 [Malassezia cuniculi]|uniref:Uncharacterized protein n=1 Tax=Malassezia cuniculi TaxID=948313 RepID=A0AAF0EQZ9_9BASI|nr:hypothetical protein MCUN1_000092 [Malassezia cuniculi]